MIVYLDYDDATGEWYVTLENQQDEQMEVYSDGSRGFALSVAYKYVDAGCADLIDDGEVIPYAPIS